LKPSAFTYHAPTTLEQALELLEEFGDDAKALAGGQSLVPMMAFRLAAFGHLVDLGRIESLRGIDERDGGLRIGAGTRQCVLETDERVARLTPIVTEATRLIGHFQIRNRGTIGGSLAHADPAAEYSAVALATDATVEVASTAGTRTLAADDLFESAYSTTLAPSELITAIEIPAARAGDGFAIRELTRRMGDFALAGAAVRVTRDGDGSLSDARVVAFAVAGRPLRLREAEQALNSGAAAADLAQALERATSDLEPADDAVATGHYRKVVIGHVAMQAIQQAVERAGNGATQQ